jgi:serine/threonine-protein kinase
VGEEERQRLIEEARKRAEQEAAHLAEGDRQQILEGARKRAEKEASRQAAKDRKRLIAEERKRAKQEARQSLVDISESPDNQPGSAPLGTAYLPPDQSRQRGLAFIIGGVVLTIIAVVAYFIFRPDGKQGETAPEGNRTVIKPDLVPIPGGVFRMGRDYRQQDGENYEWYEQQRPAHEVTVEPFEMDRTEVTNAEYAQFVRENNHRPPDDWGSNDPPKAQEQWPVRNVSLEDAQAFAAWRSKRDGVTYRLPTEEEWEFAAKGQTRNRYPWGGDWADDRANLGTNVPKPVGSYRQVDSPYGVLDMIGNASEWTSSPVTVYPGNRTITPEMMRKAYGNSFTVRGGSYADSPGGELPISVTARGFHAPSFKRHYLGFRLVRQIR